ncbi:MAG: Holliday junction resolvase RuvX [Deltaproteobacteria bacterium]|nr:Holliday junction resolvase RuvX [Deltaproteobacteria bacterium]MCL5276450.1 Holliday junction resolvase RuvX [Deltaproteobacteria bacterium]
MKRILAIDYGDVRMGLAVNDALGITAQGVCSFKRTSMENDMAKIKDVITSRHVEEIVVGMPYLLSGEKGSKAKEVEEFISMLRQYVPLPVSEWDERYTTVQAEEVLHSANVKRKKKRSVVDMLAATFILESYMESLKKGLNRAP